MHPFRCLLLAVAPFPIIKAAKFCGTYFPPFIGLPLAGLSALLVFILLARFAFSSPR